MKSLGFLGAHLHTIRESQRDCASSRSQTGPARAWSFLARTVRLRRASETS
jgi:hypothetical protein